MIIPYENYIRVAGLITFGVVAILLLRTKPRYAAGFIFGFGWYEYFTTNLGFVLDSGKLFGLICAAYIAIKPAILHSPGVKILRGKWTLYFAYCVVVTMFFAPTWPTASTGSQEFLYTTLRWFVQLVNMSLGFCIAIVIAYLTNTTERLHALTRVAMISALILAAVGLYQYVAYKTGLPINTIARQGGRMGTIAATRIDGEQTFRIYSLAGEPKGFATALCIPIILLMFMGNRPDVLMFFRSMRLPFLGAVALAFFLTLSTAGFLIIFLAMFAAVLALSYLRIEIQSTLFNFFSLGLLVILAFATLNTEGFTKKVNSILKTRVSGRLQEGGFFTYAEQGVIEFWKDSPVSIICGVGRGGSSFYIRQYFDNYEGYTAAARGIVGEVADVGLIGVGLFYVPLFGLLAQIGQRIRRRGDSRDFIVAFTICCAGIPMIATKAAWIFSFAVIGLAASLAATVSQPESVPQTRVRSQPRTLARQY